MTPEDLLHELDSFTVEDAAQCSKPFKARLRAAAARLSSIMETPEETLCRVLLTQPVEQVVVRIAADLGVFSTLAASDKPMTAAQLAEKTGAEAKLLEHVLRNLGAFNAVRQINAEEFVDVPSYSIFKDREFEKAFGQCQNIMDQIRRGVPEFLKSIDYVFPSDPTDTAVQFVFGTRGNRCTASLRSNPKTAPSMQAFAMLMNVWSDGFTQIEELYPIKEKLEEGFDPATVMFVDVGGSRGQKALALKTAFPGLPGRFVVQDLPYVIENRPQDDPRYSDIEFQAHDFFTEQPIKGARCYYIRQCLHNWTDEKCVAVLRQLKEAATPNYSRILIHEIIVPEIGSGPWVASQDFNMMSMSGVGERTKAEWQAICEEAGAKVTGIFIDDHPNREGIIEIGV